MRTSRRTATSSLLVMACAFPSVLHAQEGTVVPFKFDWKPGTVADVTSEATMSMLGNTQPTVRMTMRLTVADHPEGRVVGSQMVGAMTSGGQAMPDVAGIAGAAQNQFVVSADGRYRRLADTAKARQSADSLAATMLRKLASAPPGMREMMKQGFTVERLEAGAKQGWEQQTQGFLTRSWKVGEQHMDTVETASPFAAGQTLRTPQRTTVLALVACDSAGTGTAPARRCARVRRVSTMDAAAMKAAIERMMRERLPDGADAILAQGTPDILMETTTDMLIEVETLLIRGLGVRMVQTMSIMGSTQQSETSSTVTYTYTSR
ncbi:MAG: hypothetical protein V4617_13245 [Gemmatimonadota bacterium]